MRFRATVPILLFILLIGTGCTERRAVEPARAPVEEKPAPVTIEVGGEWTSIQNGVERMKYTFAPFESSYLLLYRFDRAKTSVVFIHRTEPLFISEWSNTITTPHVLVNGVYFHEDYLPSGQLMINQAPVGNRSFDPAETGFIQTSPFAILDTSEPNVTIKKTTDGAQSYPFFLKNGAPAIEIDSEKIARRTFVGTDQDGNIYVGILPLQSLSLFALMQILQSMPISWDEVINLDGGPSSGLQSTLESSQELIDSFGPVPNVLVVTPIP